MQLRQLTRKDAAAHHSSVASALRADYEIFPQTLLITQLQAEISHIWISENSWSDK